MQLPAVVLAAGRSVRFDGDKLATRLASGQSLAGRLMALLDAHTNIDPLIVVIAPDRDLSILAPDVRRAVAVTNTDPSRGHSSSLHLGLRAVARAKPDAPGALVFLADCPGVNTTSVDAFVAFAIEEPDAVARPVANSEPGHPVWIPRRLFEAVPSSGDAGLRPIIRDRAERVREWQTDDVGCVLDVDRPEDLAALDALIATRADR